MDARAFRQTLPPLGLSLERYTDNVPGDGAWYLLRHGRELGRYRSKAEAKDAWEAVLAETGWKPESRSVDARETFRRESLERWSRNRAG